MLMPPGPGWYPVALTAGIDSGTSAGTRLHGRELVVWRDTAGRPHVWEDRCPHRGMRLSFGFVRGGRIACLYHGWQFDGAGRCRLIPAHPNLDVPATIGVDRYAVMEWLGMIWTHEGGDAAAPHAADGGPIDVTPVRSITVNASSKQTLAALSSAAPPFAPDGPHSPAVQTGPLTAAGAGADQVLAGLQPLSDAECCLHLVIAGPLAANRGARQAHVSRWAEALRRSAEAAASGERLEHPEAVP